MVYKCSQCPREYPYRVSLQRHELTHQEIRNFKCILCVARFYNKNDLIRHVALHRNGTGEFVCKICEADFPALWLLTKHNRKWHGLDTTLASQTFKCQFCCAQGNRKGGMIRHEKVHQTTDDTFLCQPCNAKFGSNFSLSKHIKIWHSNEGKIFKCRFCIAQCRGKHNMIMRHEKVHQTKSDTFFCQPCNARFTSYISLGHHKRMWHRKKRKLGERGKSIYWSKMSESSAPDGNSKGQDKYGDSYHGLKKETKETISTHLIDLKHFFASTFIE